jgi:hypothetical protein
MLGDHRLALRNTAVHQSRTGFALSRFATLPKYPARQVHGMVIT